MNNKRPFGYMGGKRYIAEWVISHLDYSKMCYLELFGGSGTVLFAKRPHKVEIFNDNWDLLINFFMVLKNDAENLAEELSKIPYSRKLYEQYKNIDWGKLGDFEKAVYFYYCSRSAFSGGWKTGWGYGFMRNQARPYYNTLKLFSQFQERIKNVMFECRDYRDIIKSIKKEKEKDICIYADPPYMGINYYATKWTIDDHKEFAEIMNNLSCSIVISYYEFDQMKEWYPEPKWRYYYRDVVKWSAGMTRNCGLSSKPRTQEVLLKNFDNDVRQLLVNN